MFDIGFWELLVIAVVLLLVLGPERLPEVAKQAAFFVRKARQGMFRIRNEMRSELGDDPFQGLSEARREVNNLKNDVKQFGRDLADSHETKREFSESTEDVVGPEGEMLPIAAAATSVKSVASDQEPAEETTAKVTKKKTSKKKASKKKASKKVTKKTAKKVTKKTATKKVDGKQP